MTQQLKPPFNLETATQKVQRAEDLWNGNEHWEFDAQGLMQTRDASINECTIDENDRRL